MEMGTAGGTDGDRPGGCLRWRGTAGGTAAVGHSHGVDRNELRGPTRSHSDAVPDTGVLEPVGPGILECWEIGVAGDRRPGRDVVPEQRPR
jgi:hypothetical protein